MENNSLDDLKKEIDDLQKLFEDGMEELVIKNIIDKHGFDVSELEKEMTQSNSKLQVQFSVSSDDTVPPSYVYPTDSGFDLFSTEKIIIDGLGRFLVPTGLHIDIPEGYEVQIRSKSGLAIKQGLMVLNSPGTIDQGYTGEIKVIIFNTESHPVTIERGQKIAQAVISPVVCGKWINFKKVDSIEDKDRSDKGFGSTGV